MSSEFGYCLEEMKFRLLLVMSEEGRTPFSNIATAQAQNQQKGGPLEIIIIKYVLLFALRTVESL